LQIELESQVQILSKKVEEVEAQAKVAQQKLTDANVQAAKEQVRYLAQLARSHALFCCLFCLTRRAKNPSNFSKFFCPLCWRIVSFPIRVAHGCL